MIMSVVIIMIENNNYLIFTIKIIVYNEINLYTPY